MEDLHIHHTSYHGTYGVQRIRVLSKCIFYKASEDLRRWEVEISNSRTVLIIRKTTLSLLINQRYFQFPQHSRSSETTSSLSIIINPLKFPQQSPSSKKNNYFDSPNNQNTLPPSISIPISKFKITHYQPLLTNPPPSPSVSTPTTQKQTPTSP